MAATAEQEPAVSRLKLTEIFFSIQGEAVFSGWPTVFVRLTGCPLRCQYCDTAYAFTGGEWWTFAEIETEVEEASATLGAGRFYTLRRVILPALAPAALTGFALSLARAVGEYGSVIFIAGNLPMKTEIAPLLIVIKLEEFDYDGAAAIGIAMLLIAFSMLLVINLIQIWSRRRIGHV